MGVSSTAPATPHPAQATTAPNRPSPSATERTPASTDASRSTSMVRGLQPSGELPRRLAPKTFHPCWCKRSAQARPIPADAPVMSTTSPDETTSHVSSIRSPDQTGPARPHLHLFEPSRFVLAPRGFRIAPESDPSHESRIQVHCRFTLALPDRVPYELTMLALR